MLAAMLKREAAPVGKVKAGGASSTPSPVSSVGAYKPPQRAIPGLAPQLQQQKPITAKKQQQITPSVKVNPAVATKAVVPVAKTESSTPMPTPVPTPATAGKVIIKAEDIEKKVKALKKKLKQIDEIKDKLKQGGNNITFVSIVSTSFTYLIYLKLFLSTYICTYTHSCIK